MIHPFQKVCRKINLLQDSFKTNDSSGLKPLAPPSDKKTNSWKLSFIADAGISGFKNNPFSVFENVQSDYPASMPVFDGSNGSPGTPGSTFVYKIPAYQNGFFFNAGLQARKSIDNQNSIAVELAYGLYQTKISVGKKIDTLVNQPGTLYGNTFYLNGNKSSYTNHYHFLQLSANYFYQFNMHHKLPLRWKLGIGGAYMIASNGLHYSQVNSMLVKNNRLFNNPQVFINTGFEFGIGKNPWYIGPQLRYFLMPSDKKTVFKNGHLSAISIGATIPFQKK